MDACHLRKTGWDDIWTQHVATKDGDDATTEDPSDSEVPLATSAAG